MKTIYRVEHRDHGHGPYLTNDCDMFYGVEGLHDAHEASRKHPGPRGDDGLDWDYRQRHQFGFGSRKRLDEWFKGFKRKLHEAGFVIRVYEAPDDSTSISKHQAIFIKEESRLIETIPVVRWA